MYSTKQNVQQLTSLMLKAGITKVVVCPGSRNIPLVHNFVAADMECYEVTDERSAGFFALGLIEANGGEPVAVCCTSGSAVLNLAPAVSEAYYRPLPLLVITADRPLRWINQMDGQTMIQPEAFANYVRKTVTLPEDDRWLCNRLVNEAFMEQKKTSGPVHIDVPINEPFFDFTAESLPAERLIEYIKPATAIQLPQSLQSAWQEAQRPMLIVGQLSPEDIADYGQEFITLARKGCTILAEHLSNLHTLPEAYTYINFSFDEQLRTDGSIPQPDLVITLGGHIVSKRIKQYLRAHQPHTHIQVSQLGELADLFTCATTLVEADNKTALMALNSIPARFQNPLPANDSPTEDHILNTILPRIDSEWAIHVANSTMVRTLIRHFRGTNPVYCNRGINGIEGSTSAAVGYWAGTHRPTLLLTGDLSFFYDQNALWNNFVKNPQAPLRIFILNNGCGDIFHHLPGLHTPALDQYISAHHTTTAQGIASQCHATYFVAHNEDELQRHLPSFCKKDNTVIILEYFHLQHCNKNRILKVKS